MFCDTPFFLHLGRTDGVGQVLLVRLVRPQGRVVVVQHGVGVVILVCGPDIIVNKRIIDGLLRTVTEKTDCP